MALRQFTAILCLLAIGMASLTPPPVLGQDGGLFGWLRSKSNRETGHPPYFEGQPRGPETGKDSAVERLAEHIDWLEQHVDTYGSIVAKHPDIWGESRLMRHRYEYEQQVANELGKFQVRLNGALRRSDQSFLGMAFAQQARSFSSWRVEPVGKLNRTTRNIMSWMAE